MIGAIGEVIAKVQRFDGKLADQLRRAASSVHLNIGEGARRSGGNRRLHYEIAYGSAGEVKAALEVAQLWGWLDAQSELLSIIDRLLGLLYGCVHGPKHARSRAIAS